MLIAIGIICTLILLSFFIRMAIMMNNDRVGMKDMKKYVEQINRGEKP